MKLSSIVIGKTMKRAGLGKILRVCFENVNHDFFRHDMHYFIVKIIMKEVIVVNFVS